MREPVAFTWPNGPTFRLTRTALAVDPSEEAVRRALRQLPSWARRWPMVRDLWLRRLYIRHPLTRIGCALEENVLTLHPADGHPMRWHLPPEAIGEAAEFVAELHRRQALRIRHISERGKGQSLVPWAVLCAAGLWVIRRVRRA